MIIIYTKTRTKMSVVDGFSSPSAKASATLFSKYKTLYLFCKFCLLKRGGVAIHILFSHTHQVAVNELSFLICLYQQKLTNSFYFIFVVVYSQT